MKGVSRGYDVQEHNVVTKDKYVLKLHRIIHPQDIHSNGPKPGMKKPYLLLHGLIGSSASYVRNINPNYKAPNSVYNLREKIHQTYNPNSNNFIYHQWQSTAEKFHGTSETEVSTINQALHNLKTKRKFSDIDPIDFDGDSNDFGKQFKNAYKGFTMSMDTKHFITNSLAFTLCNFNYDVWLINLRGNQYSRESKSRYSSEDAEYWNFNIDTIVKEDLLAVINYVKNETQYHDSMGLVSYSFSSLYVLNLLTKFPDYQDTLQPIVMMAPTLLNPAGQGNKSKLFIKAVSKALVAHNGAWPVLGRSKNSKIERIICQLPIASGLCHLLEIVLYGGARTENIPKYLISDHKTQLIKKDMSCGQTSTAILHQIVDNLSHENIHPNYVPFVQARNRREKRHNQEGRRTVILIHSKDDKISTNQDVIKIRDKALKTMALMDLVIKEPHFDHTDFLFAKQNQYLVNAEIVRMVSIYDFLIDGNPPSIVTEQQAPKSRQPNSSVQPRH